MRHRFWSFLIAALLLTGALSSSVGVALACQIAAATMPADCPMRQPATAKPVAKPAHSCCAPADPPAVTETMDATRRCCCDMSGVPDTAPVPDIAFLAVEKIVAIPPTEPLLPLAHVSYNTALPALRATDETALRGPPRVHRIPRAPPFVS